MNVPDNVNNAFLKQSKEHQIIIDYVARLDKTLMSQNNDALLALIRSVAHFLQRDLRAHFEMEETLFFPAVLINSPTPQNVQLILRLQHEHGTLSRDLHWMTEAIERAKSQQAQVDQELLRYFRPFLHALKSHARIEILELYPLIDQHPACVEWIRNTLNGR